MKKTPIALFVSALMMPTVSWAQAENPKEEAVPNHAESVVLDEVVVKSTSFSQQIGTQKLTEKEIAQLPATNGNITDLLKHNPNVRFSGTSDNSNSGGEIKPNEVSFHGEKFYNNNFIVNGMSNNDNLNPPNNSRYTDTRPAGANAYDLPAGSTQSFWIDTRMVKSVEAFDSNISAKYGRFTGGVVDVKLKDPELDKHSGSVSFRTTNERWAEFHTDNNRTLESATALNLQPKYTKQEYGLMLNQPLSDKAAVRFAYSRKTSDIQYYHPNLQTYDENRHLSEKAKFGAIQRRLNENFLLNGIYLPDNGDLWRLTLTYAPNRSKFYKQDVVNGAYTNTGGGFQADLEWEKTFENVAMTSRIGYKQSGNRISHQEEDYYRYQASNYLDWVSSSGFAMFGGYGKSSVTSTDLLFKQDFKINEFDWANTAHKIETGWEAKITKAAHQRDKSSHNYIFEKANVICHGAEACIDGEQYATTDQITEARHKKVRDDAYSAYIQDTMTWKNLEVIAGLRMDYNQFLGKLNIAHRLSGSYDLFGDEKTRLFAGLNRYYANSMLSYKLRQGASQSLRVSRELNSDGTVGEWYNPRYTYINNYSVAKLDNPYSDEIVAGLAQDVFGSLWTLKWVHRNSKKSLLSIDAKDEYGQAVRVLSNQGWSKNDTFTLSIKPANSKHDFGFAKLSYDLGFSYNKTKTNSDYYTSEEDTHYIIYNNKLLTALGGRIPRDFNNPWSVKMKVLTEFPSIGLSWGQSLSYIAGRKYIYTDTKISCNGSSTVAAYREACGSHIGEVSAYKDAYQASHFMLDWRFSYKQPTFKGQYLQLDLDINNVLNRKAAATGADGNTVYKMGRNFWFGISYNW